MNKPFDRPASVSAYPRFALRPFAAVVLGASVVAVLTACATPPGALTPQESPTPTVATASPTPTTTPTESVASPIPDSPDPDAPDPTPTAAGPASVTIVNSGADGTHVSASGLVTGVDDADGTCTLTATSADGRVLVGSIQAMPTPAAVNCGIIDIDATSGTWSLVMRYSVGDVIVDSAPVTVTQP